MKKTLLMLVAGAAVALTASCSPAKRVAVSEADTATGALVAGMLSNRLYKIDFERAFPLSAPSFALRDAYYISVIGDRVESFLPYFGRAYSVPYGGGEGLRFEAPIGDYVEKSGRGGRHDISFTARTSDDTYDFTLRVYPGGRSDLTIRPVRKQSISFSGAIDPEPDFEAARRRTE